jgi:hypothetical protein
MTHMHIDRQRLGKHIPEVTLPTIGHPLLGNGSINTHSRHQKTVFSVGSMPRSYLEDSVRYKHLRVES